MNKAGRSGHKSKGINHHSKIEERPTSVLKQHYIEISGFSRVSYLYETASIVRKRITNELLKRGEQIPISN